jgi:hypothetical protein
MDDPVLVPVLKNNAQSFKQSKCCIILFGQCKDKTSVYWMYILAKFTGIRE